MQNENQVTNTTEFLVSVQVPYRVRVGRVIGSKEDILYDLPLEEPNR
jgi:hypothetical protein